MNEKLTSRINQQFAMVPAALILSRPPPSAFLLFGYLQWRAGANGRSWPTWETILEDTGLSKPTISAAIEWLEAAGFLRVQRRPSKVSTYVLLGTRPVRKPYQSVKKPESNQIPIEPDTKTTTSLREGRSTNSSDEPEPIQQARDRQAAIDLFHGQLKAWCKGAPPEFAGGHAARFFLTRQGKGDTLDDWTEAITRFFKQLRPTDTPNFSLFARSYNRIIREMGEKP